MKRKILKIIILIAILVGLSVGIYFILKALGIGDIATLQSYILDCGIWAWFVFLLIQISLTVVLCFVPGTSMTMITVGILCFGANWKTFILCFSGVILSSFIMDLIGRFGGSRVIIKLIGEDSYNEAMKLLDTKGLVYVPVMYLLPVFPDDAICMACGAMKVKWWVHYIEIVLCRGIGCATIVFGINLLPEEVTSFTSTNIWDYIVVITVLAFWVIILLWLARKIDKWLTKKLEKKTKDEEGAKKYDDDVM